MSHVKNSTNLSLLYGISEESSESAEWDEMEVLSNGSLMQILINDDADRWDVEFKNTTRFWVQFILIPIITIIGMLGNVVTTYILTRKQMHTSSIMYLTSLALSDFIFLTFSFSLSWKHYDYMKHKLLYWKYIPFGVWMAEATNSTSVWLTVSFTIERYIAVCHPIFGKINLIGKRAKYVSGLVCITCFLLTCSIPFEWKVVEKQSITDSPDFRFLRNLDYNQTVYSLQYTNLGKNSTYRLLSHWFSVIFFIFIPLITLATLNIFLIQAVRNSRKNRDTMTASHLQNQRHKQEDRITITLISVVIVFLVCRMPAALLLIYKSLNIPPEPGSQNENILLGLGHISKLLININAASNFLLYTALSDRFRRAFTTILYSKYWRFQSNRDLQLLVIYRRENDR